MFTQNANKIFAQAIDDYHRYDDVDHQLSNPYAEGTIDHLLYICLLYTSDAADEL